YTGRSPVIPSSLADTPCATLGVQGVLDRLNATLRTSYTLDTPSLCSILEDCIEKNYDFGTAYGHLRQIWYTDDWSNIQERICWHEEEYMEMRQRALVGNQIIDSYLPPRRECPKPISHAWVDDKNRVDMWTPINGKEWPVPIPKDANLDLIRIEMLNLGLQYTWLDVLCLRQKDPGGPKEDLRMEEWKLDVPTIGNVYMNERVVIYLSGLGLPLSLKEGDLDSDQCWFRRAWTLQEGCGVRIIAGDTSDGPLHVKPINEDGNYETLLLTRFHKQLVSRMDYWAIFSHLFDMQKRVSTNDVDKVAGLTFPLHSGMIPAYHESESVEDAWTALVNSMNPIVQAHLLFLYPGVGLSHKKWRPSWKQVM
ncbi:hypothetical protein ARMSODRAFT_843261, partial [Armillaria solidipes]